MNQSTVLSSLQEIARSSEAANAVFHLWAARKRARHQVTIHSLAQRMRQEGFNFTPQEYAQVIEKLGKLGLGNVEKDRRGRIRALKGVNLTLQSIGSVAVGGKKSLDKFSQRKSYQELVTKAQESVKAAVAHKPVEFSVLMTVVVNGKPINLNVPRNLSTEEIANLIERLQGK